MKKILIVAASVLILGVALCAVFIGIGYHKFMAVEAVEPDPQLEILIGGGGNTVILTSEDGSKALVVDTKMGSAAKLVRAKVKAREVIVVNTHAHSDHTGGNRLFRGARFIAGAYTPEQWKAVAGKNVAYPDETVGVGQEKIVRIGNEAAHIRNLGRGHTFDDVVVYLEHRKLLATGDLVFLDRHPALIAASGTSTSAWIADLGLLDSLYDVKTLVPGHGPVSGKSALLHQKEYFVSIRDALGDKNALAHLKRVYAYYGTIPMMADFGRTVRFMEQERQK